MATILIAGGTGLIGTSLSALLSEKGHRVLLLSRQAPTPSTSNPMSQASALPLPASFHWDPAAGAIDTEAIRQADIIINLAGAGIADRRWTARRKQLIEESRTRSGALIVSALREIPNKVCAVISASGIGWYGADPAMPNRRPIKETDPSAANPRPFTETDPPDKSYLGETCRRWEAAIAGVDTRLVIFRIGPVLTPKGGALKEFLRPAKMGIAAILGSGRQVLSWIHIDDLCRLFLYAVEHEDMHGIYNAVAPQPIDNRTLMINLSRRLKGSYYVPVYIPSFLLKMTLGGLSIEVLKSTTVSPEKIHNAGFQFLYPSIDSALDHLLRKAGGRPDR